MLGIALVCLMVCAGLTARDAAAQTAGGNGLKGQYYDNQNLTARELTRTDPTVNFSWGTGSPARSIDPDTFSARWTGQVEAPVSGTYTFYTQTSDGVRLWVNGEPLIGKWVDQNTREWSGRISLEAGERYPIKMEYFEGTGGAVAKLLWSRPGVEKRVVPRSRLYLPGTPPPIDGERWSDPATWGGELPGEGEAVTIPADKTVVLDTSPPPLKSLQIDGTLVFDDRDLTLSADWIMVHGKLQIGAEGAPFRHEATISLTGTNRDENVMGMGPKVLGVMGGTLELHGERRLSWTKLGATAARGSTQITLDEAPGWRAGDRIVISSTDYDPFQREEATIEAVSGNVVTLDRALAYTHWGRVQTFDGRSVDERAEVALLSHNVRIEGEEASSADGFGGQIMVMEGGNARLDGVELTRMGQKNILRRYPIHFHMLGDAPGSYLKNSSLHHTFNRCVTVHGTNRLTLQGNVCYDHLGHGYFLEDGAEHDNLITDNLGLLTRRPADGERLLPTDSSPATFWITNPDNVIRGNVAAGSQGMGFWYALPEHPTGLSADANIWPRRTSLSEFSGNVAHSNDGDGLHVDGGPNQTTLESETTNYRPRQDPAAGSPPVVARFEGFVGYKNRHRAVWLRGSDHRLVDATLADNGIGATFASWESMLTDSLVVGETANKGNPRSWETRGLDGRSLPRYWDEGFPIRGYEFYDGRVGAERTTFVNFTPNTQRQASGLGYNLSNAFSIHPKNFASSLSFVDANRVYLPDPVAGMDGDASSVFLDTDGSVTGTPGRYVVVNNPFLLNGGCDFRTDWNAHVCQAEYATLTVGTGDGAPGAIKPLTLSRSDGVTQTLMGCCEDSTNADSSVFTNRRYVVAFNGGTPSRMRFVLTRGRDRWVRLSVDYPVTPKVTKYGCDLADPDDWCEGAAGSLAELDAAAGSSYYYDDAADKLYFKLVSTDVDYEELEVEPSSP
jgi:cell migration-inducing and hyaluronan-binding protein